MHIYNSSGGPLLAIIFAFLYHHNAETNCYFKISAITIFAPNCQKDDDAENPNQGRKATSEHQGEC